MTTSPSPDIGAMLAALDEAEQDTTGNITSVLTVEPWDGKTQQQRTVFRGGGARPSTLYKFQLLHEEAPEFSCLATKDMQNTDFPAEADLAATILHHQDFQGDPSKALRHLQDTRRLSGLPSPPTASEKDTSRAYRGRYPSPKPPIRRFSR